MDNLKILVIDDDPVTCKLLETMLQMEGFQTASTNQIKTETFMELLYKENPHMLILDFHVGSNETKPYVELIRADETWHTLPILMMSGINHQKASLKAGANHFILKPFDWQEIISLIHKMKNNLIQ